MNHTHALPPNQVDSTSTQLLARLGQQDAEAWRQFVLVYGPVVRYWIRRAGLSHTDLADVFQDVFLAVSRNIAAFHRETGVAKFRAWLKTITLNKVYDHFRRQGKQPAEAFGGSTALLRLNEVEAAAPPDAGDDHDEALAHSEDTFLAQRTLHIVKKEFTEQSWTAFYRTAIDGLTSQEVAAELGITPLAVRKAKSRVLQRLKEALGGNLPPT
ncbi:MAG: sigma-70 family RNA polymerase sigma factor [Planctomycetaceae bacterium]|nr:sigma-70 family RNA polymerase sigma factor [Planctomycetaceae bacterium]